ncbi:hypothetical protein EXIGLDRAFT_776349 [Exidia glandulosa HHB12029]|uniref:Uncharacterized protein n=1 Tax=Exidia glandulosa HHB12029 TaxID=1314781 RepID=A0A165DIH0_EXIGL|nr:hypothetical protein EXIGLDRAFT_776349 [Exidia glandulosa HHB12029]
MSALASAPAAAPPTKGVSRQPDANGNIVEFGLDSTLDCECGLTVTRSGERLAGLKCRCGMLDLLSLRSLGDDPRTLDTSDVLSFAEESLSSPCSTLRVHSPGGRRWLPQPRCALHER